MILNGHMHISELGADKNRFIDGLKSHGIDGGILISLAPSCFEKTDATVEERINDLLRYTSDNQYLFPFFWIDAIEEDALNQVDYAIERGMVGFKVICSQHKPSHPKAMETYKYIAKKNKPIMFHSGILYDGQPSSEFNRPAEFECMLTVPNLRFSMAHISWPWCDELIAVYGKFRSAKHHHPEKNVELFVDITPGTPPIYRKDALTKLYTVGFNIENNVWYGSDGSTSNLPEVNLTERMERDNSIYDELGLSAETIDKIYSKNLLRFIGAK